MSVTKLPKQPSELIRLAVKDMKLLMNNPDFIIDMGKWVVKDAYQKCSVCMAGAVMVGEGFIPKKYLGRDSGNEIDVDYRDITYLIEEGDWTAFSLLDSVRFLNTHDVFGIEAFVSDLRAFCEDPEQLNILNSNKFRLKIKVNPFNRDDDNNNEAFFADVEVIASYLEGIGL